MDAASGGRGLYLMVWWYDVMAWWHDVLLDGGFCSFANYRYELDRRWTVPDIKAPGGR